MAKNNKHWKRMMASSTDRKIAKEGRDPLEEGLEAKKDLKVFPGSRIRSA